MTRTTIATAVTTTALAAALLSGCGSGGQPAASSSSMPNVASAPSSSSAAPAPATSSPTSSKPSRSVEMAGAPGVPKPARMHTKAGAEAFVKHYFDVVNETGVQPEKNQLEPLATSSCKSCLALSQTVATMVDQSQQYSAEPVEVGSPSVVGWVKSRADVQVHLVQLPVTRMSASGTAVEQVPRASASYVCELRWTTAGWRVNNIFSRQ